MLTRENDLVRRQFVEGQPVVPVHHTTPILAIGPRLACAVIEHAATDRGPVAHEGLRAARHTAPHRTIGARGKWARPRGCRGKLGRRGRPGVEARHQAHARVARHSAMQRGGQDEHVRAKGMRHGSEPVVPLRWPTLWRRSRGERMQGVRRREPRILITERKEDCSAQPRCKPGDGRHDGTVESRPVRDPAVRPVVRPHRWMAIHVARSAISSQQQAVRARRVASWRV
jgi:hypothetical protein